jgi:trehalose 6-phosphate phosphatase
VAILHQQPAGFFTDCDGTISRIAPRPELATIAGPCRGALASLSRRLALVAIVSGRGAGDVKRLVGVPGIVYVGNHGLEIWRGDGPEPVPGAQGFVEPVQRALAELADQLGPLPGLVFENKGLTASIHYRLTEDHATVRLAILHALRQSPGASQLRITEGRKVVELRPPLSIDKGSAVVSLAEGNALRAAMYLGDDTTDVDAFRALKEWSRRTGNPSLAVGVAADDSVAVAVEADLRLSGVDEVEELLRALSSLLMAADDNPRVPRHGSSDRVSPWSTGR